MLTEPDILGGGADNGAALSAVLSFLGAVRAVLGSMAPAPLLVPRGEVRSPWELTNAFTSAWHLVLNKRLAPSQHLVSSSGCCFEHVEEEVHQRWESVIHQFHAWEVDHDLYPDCLRSLPNFASVIRMMKQCIHARREAVGASG